MNRLTFEVHGRPAVKLESDTVVCTGGIHNGYDSYIHCKAIDRLAQYENTGLSPDEVCGLLTVRDKQKTLEDTVKKLMEQQKYRELPRDGENVIFGIETLLHKSGLPWSIEYDPDCGRWFITVGKEEEYD